MRLAAVFWVLWKATNNVSSEKKRMKSPTEIVSSLLLFISYWEGLQNLESCNELEQGVAVLKTLALVSSTRPAARRPGESGDPRWCDQLKIITVTRMLFDLANDIGIFASDVFVIIYI